MFVATLKLGLILCFFYFFCIGRQVIDRIAENIFQAAQNKSAKMSSAIEQLTTSKRPRSIAENEFIDLTDGSMIKTAKNHNQNVKNELVDLSDDCLIHLFRYLWLNDLNALGAICHQFRDFVANNVYRYHTSLKRFDIVQIVHRHPENDMDYKLECIKGYLDRYGRFIEHIEFDATKLEGMDNIIFTFIANCDPVALKSQSKFIFGDNINSAICFCKFNQIGDGRSFELLLCDNLEELKLYLPVIDTKCKRSAL